MRPDGGVVPFPLPFASAAERLRTAIDRLEEEAKAESSYPDTVMGKWVGMLRDLMRAFQTIEQGREEQLRMLARITQAADRAEADAARAKADHPAWTEAVIDRVADRVGVALLVRARAHKQSQVFAALLCIALFASAAWNGYNLAALDRCRDMLRQRQAEPYGTAHRSSDPGGREANPLFQVLASPRSGDPKAGRHPVGSAGWPL